MKYRVGLDIGSTTIKMVVINAKDDVVMTRYERHQARVPDLLREYLGTLHDNFGNEEITFCITGSIGMGVAEKYGLPFEQEVVAATHYIHKYHPNVSSMIDIGGEDAKVVFLNKGGTTDLRMNGNCAGGTGAFIDQMAILLGIDVDTLGQLALKAQHVYSIASRCGVFCKTDIQNLIAKNVSKEDIAASIFHAVAVQTVVTLAHGYDIKAPLLFCGGPLSFIPALRKAFTDYLHLNGEGDTVLPANSHLIPAWGAALSGNSVTTSVDLLTSLVASQPASEHQVTNALSAIFDNDADYKKWKVEKLQYHVRRTAFKPGRQIATMGIDSGSTTTKIVVLTPQGEMLYSFYQPNNGDPIKTVRDGLSQLDAQCKASGTELVIRGGCSTGYGEDLVKAAFSLDGGIIETIAHFMAAKHIRKDVSFILDIGGQDMKAIFVNDGIIHRIEINEACSSGCGSFIGTFAKSLGYELGDFASEACQAKEPCDLGTRCTVFMNSRVKQVLREGATVADIAAGLSYSVVKNCLYKVLQLKNVDSLGSQIVVQGGTMRNDSIVRALERLTGKEVFRSDCPELMGALGCALYAGTHGHARETTLQEMMTRASFSTKKTQCKGCENACLVTAYSFDNGNHYYAGNRCERIFNNKGEYAKQEAGDNVYMDKRQLLFGRTAPVNLSDNPTGTLPGQEAANAPRVKLGIPRCLNIYEEFPFWHTLFTRCGIDVCLSSASTFGNYEKSVKLVMADNICFPAKLVHSHISELMGKGVDRIFMPFVVFERNAAGEQNSYNCPIVSGYSEVVKGVQGGKVPIDSPTISFKEKKSLQKQCCDYLATLGVKKEVAKTTFKMALAEQEHYEKQIALCNKDTFTKAEKEKKLVLLLAGRPYHADQLIQHNISTLIASMGATVITDDIVRGSEDLSLDDVHFVSQWAYPDRILKAAKWVALQGDNVQMVELTSFGCGPDAFLTDEVRSLLQRHGKTLTLLKIDDVNNVGSIRLRVRSLIESLKLSAHKPSQREVEPFITTPPFTKEDRKRKILAPFFTPFLSPLIPALMQKAGYEADNLPLSSKTSADWGLRTVNNEVCYPATLIVGDVINAFKSGLYDPSHTAVAISQTGGQCRASNYISLIKKALTENGFAQVPVVSIAFGGNMGNVQPGFRVNWLKVFPIALASILFSDSLAKCYYATIGREKSTGQANKLRDHYLRAARAIIKQGKPSDLYDLLRDAAKDFNQACREGINLPKVGIVGEIFLKFNPYAQKHVTEWLISRSLEVVPPMMIDFFMQSFVNRKAKKESHLRKRGFSDLLSSWINENIRNKMKQVNEICKPFTHFTPFGDIFEEAEEASKVISLDAQFGEGWLLPGEIMSFAKQGIKHVVSLQPFGCIANQIVAKGIEKKIKAIYPDMNLLSLDFDSSVSDVNITNRLLLFIGDLNKKEQTTWQQ
jgi:predicted CoA-substrate-specific enzyme activase